MADTLSPAGANSGAEGSSVSSGYDANITQPASFQAHVYENIPDELKALPHWIVWREEHKPGQAKLAKVPYTPGINKHADTTEPKTWRAFNDALAAFNSGGWSGIGFVFHDSDPYAGIDFDYTDDAQQLAHQQRWAQRFNSYSERSPSGKGLHVIVRGRVPKGVNSRTHKIEVYSSERFFTMTGNVYNAAWIVDRQPDLDALYAELSAARSVTSMADTPDEQQTLSDEVVLERLFNGANGDKYRQLWAGDWRTVLDSQGKPYWSQSEADFALMEGLRFQSASRTQCVHLFRQSGLYRAEKRGGYIERMAGKLGARPAIPESVAAYSQRFAAEMAAGASAHAQVGSPPQSPSHITGAASVSAVAAFSPLTPPEPLSHELPSAPPFPVDALGPILSAAARAIEDIVQCPMAIAAQSVLGAASLAVQAHANVVIPATGDARPVSLFLLTVAESGERKSAADSKALSAVNVHEREQFKRYDAELPAYNMRRQAWEIERKQADKSKGSREQIEQHLQRIGPPPEPPLKPLLTCPEPTYEGLYKLFEAGSPTLGLFSDEGAHFVSGHGMKAENRLAMAGGLSNLWDGTPPKRVRATGEATMLPGRRLSMHLMMQPDVSANLLSDSDLKDQGLLSRILVCAPDPKAGTRFQKPHNWNSANALAAYHAHIARILAAPLPLTVGERNELAPWNYNLSPEAVDLWRQYADEVERKAGPNGEYAPIKGLANKLPEHALRLAAVIALVNSNTGKLGNIPADAFTCGMQLANYYASEALRLWDSAVTRPEIKLAKKLLAWLHERDSDTIMLREIYRQGLAGMRAKAEALAVVRVLVDHLWLIPAGDKTWTVRR